MNALRTFARRLARFFGRTGIDSRLAEEVRFHIEASTARNMAAGMNAADARRAALRQFGNVESTKETVRDTFRFAWIEDVWRDLVIGARGLRRNPGFAAATLVTLALGIGGATAMFSVVNGVFLKSLPYPDAGRIVRLYQIDADGDRSSVSDANFNDWKAASRRFEAMAEMNVAGALPITGEFEPHLARVAPVSREFFDVMRVKPALGRAFLPDEHSPSAPPRAIVSDAYWRRVLGGASPLGAPTLRSGSRVFTVIGVMPPGFVYPGNTEIWVPTELDAPATSRTAHNYSVVARVADGADIDAAQLELSSISRALKAQHGDGTWMSDAVVVPLRDQLTASAKPALTVLFVSALVLLLISCTNVSNLLIARAATRDRELAVRLTMGAGRWRVARQLLAETVLICVAGGALGVLLAQGGVRLLLRLQPAGLPRITDISVNWTVLGFAFGVSTLAALALGLVTALRIPDTRISSTLSGSARTSAGGRAGRRVRESLVVAQVALTLVLLSGAGLLVRSFVRVLSVEPGYRTDDALVLDFAAPPASGNVVTFQRDLVAKLGALPGVTHTGLINDFPLGGGWYANGQFIEMTTPTEIRTLRDYARFRADKARIGHAGFRVASAGYFGALGIPLIEGRLFDERDAAGAEVHAALVSKSLAQAKWPDQDPLGRFIQFGNMDGDTRALRVIGVVGDIREFGLESAPAPLLYVLNEQRPRAASRFSVIVRGPHPSSIAGAAQRIARDLAPDVPVSVRSVAAAFDQSLSGRRFNLVVIASFAAVALALAVLGLYGLVAYLANQRRREFGIRVALGARATEIVRLVVGKSLVLSFGGIVLGLAAALALTRLMQQLLFGITATDPVALGAVVAVMLGAVAIASYLPARRATRVAPSAVLRVD